MSDPTLLEALLAAIRAKHAARAASVAASTAFARRVLGTDTRALAAAAHRACLAAREAELAQEVAEKAWLEAAP